MQWIACSLIFCFILVAPFSDATTTTATIKVRIKSLPSSVALSGLNIRFLGLEAKFRAVAVSQNKNVEISRVIVAEKPYWQISQNQNQNQNLLSAQEALIVQGEDLRLGATELPNQVLLRENASNQIDVIGLVPLEEYVLAVLVSEMPLSWPLETLKAQAVAIRSYTLAVIQERAQKDFHLESSVLDQVYKKIHQGINPALLQKAQAAVTATRGMTLQNLKRKTLKAFYHSDCGGKTVPASSVWRQETDSDMGVAVDDFCASNPRSQWRLRITKEKFQSLLQTFSGKLHSNEFRKRVGFMELKSTNFEAFEKEDHIEFIGRGFGHGAGLCQWGSKFLGQKGFTYQRILKHYYPLATLKKISN